jgi:hypothetical protein
MLPGTQLFQVGEPDPDQADGPLMRGRGEEPPREIPYGLQGVRLMGDRPRPGPGDESRVPDLQGERPEKEVLPPDSLVEVGGHLIECVEECVRIIGILLEGRLPAYRSGSTVPVHLADIPPESKFMHGEAPFAEPGLQELDIKPHEITDGEDPHLFELSARLFPYSRYLPDRQWRKELLDLIGRYNSQPVGFREVGCDLRDNPRRSDPDRAGEPLLLPDLLLYLVSELSGCGVISGMGYIKEGLINAHLVEVG